MPHYREQSTSINGECGVPITRICAKTNMVDATSMCRFVGNHWAHFAATKKTQDFLADFARVSGVPPDGIVRRDADGTVWVHCQVANIWAARCGGKATPWIVEGLFCHFVTQGENAKIKLLERQVAEMHGEGNR